MNIVKTKFLCKSDCKVYDGSTSSYRFINGKWYDGEWSSDDGYRINNGWRRYWVIDQNLNKQNISKAKIKLIFETDIQNIRDSKIDIINNQVDNDTKENYKIIIIDDMINYEKFITVVDDVDPIAL